MCNLLEYLTILFQWLKLYGGWFLGASLVMIITSIIGLRYFIIRMPPDFFVKPHGLKINHHHSIISAILYIFRNILGVIFVIVGLVLSIPGVAGQGFLTILVGLLLLDFPGKRKLTLKIARKPVIRNVINNIRIKAGKSPLILDENF